ncbi:MAG TPA: YciI family protein [Phycicoccus sp.]|nr:YciI family protein [Phycicoccus sp.]
MASETVISDGPYAETKEHLGGLTIIEAPDDATAHYWAGRIAEGCGWPQEVRRFGARPDGATGRRDTQA